MDEQVDVGACVLALHVLRQPHARVLLRPCPIARASIVRTPDSASDPRPDTGHPVVRAMHSCRSMLGIEVPVQANADQLTNTITDAFSTSASLLLLVLLSAVVAVMVSLAFVAIRRVRHPRMRMH